jgi:hypothetical protein
MHIAKCSLKSVTPYSQSKNIDPHEVTKKPKETGDAYEQRVWRHRIHQNADGFVIIPRTAFPCAIKSAARRLQLQVPGKGKTQYTKYFEAGIDVLDDLALPIKAEDIPGERLFVPSDGRPGGGKRVYKTFPKIGRWEGIVTFFVLDDIITRDIFTQVLRSAGLLVGIGRFRPESRGYYGRFSVEQVDWTEDGDSVVAAAE